MFERYVRGDHDRVAGSGLGLAIVCRVAKYLEWDIRCEDRPGGGSRFVLSFGARVGPLAVPPVQRRQT